MPESKIQPYNKSETEEFSFVFVVGTPRKNNSSIIGDVVLDHEIKVVRIMEDQECHANGIIIIY